uniref:7TM_GPCR_Srx domain-containing protein n=1 Tax=Meloidogyne hapla TaxID=6305 RepID=A0A1I8BT38_MELHA
MAFTFPPGPNYTETETKIFFAADILELAANSLLACPISTINFILILKTSILHPNLKLILLCQSLCIFIRGIGRISLNLFRICLYNVGTKGSPILIIFYFLPVVVRNCIMHVLVIERIMATLMSKNYEKYTSNQFSFSWISITLSENIRTAKQLIPCIIIHFINIISPAALVFMAITNIQFLNLDLGEECSYVFITITLFLIELSMIMLHPFLKRDLLNYCKLFFGCRFFGSNNVSIVPTDDNNIAITVNRARKLQPMDLHGRPLITENKEDYMEEYFKQLTISWQ